MVNMQMYSEITWVVAVALQYRLLSVNYKNHLDIKT
jgi:hypothetical protein